MTRRPKTELEPGDPAPPFALEDAGGKVHRLADYRGRWVVLYFYPRDNTPGCTAQACAFRDARPRLTRRKVVVLGVSADSVASHARFAARYELDFPLLSDPAHEACTAYGVWKQKVLYGRRFMGIERSTFVVDPDGVVRNIYRKIRVEGHIEEVLGVIPAR